MGQSIIFVASPMKTIVIFLLCLVSVCACNREAERLQAENDSLRHELNTRYSVVVTMNDIKVLIDSIDESRNVLRGSMNEGTTYDDFTSRLKDINKYVEKTEEKLTTIENELKETKGEASAYMMMVAALKDELGIRADEVSTLEKQVNDYKSENKGLIQTVKVQKDELTDMHTQIEVKQEELSLLEAKVDELVANFKVSEAEAYYARAKAVEEAANRTKLAPTKKRETYKEALELYKKSLGLGKKEAQENINALKKKVK
jgi:chromosome segregation ATPase